MYSPQLRTGKRGDKQTKAQVSRASVASASKDILAAEDSPTVRQRLNEARKSGLLDLSSLNLSVLPEDSNEMDNLTCLLLGGNNFTAVPPNLASNFPNLIYLDLSRNQISSIPTSLAELEELFVLDLSGNAALANSPIAPAFTPVRDRMAILVDKESTGGVESSEEEESEDQNGFSTDDNDSDDNSNKQPPRKLRDLMEDVALESRRFFKQLELVDEAYFDELEGSFKRLLAAKDPLFLKYLQRRYGAREDEEEQPSRNGDAAEEVARRRQYKEQLGFERREKDKIVSESKGEGRRQKANRMDSFHHD